jgi:hypothetical protein
MNHSPPPNGDWSLKLLSPRRASFDRSAGDHDAAVIVGAPGVSATIMSVDRIETNPKTDVHGPDDHRSHHGYSGGVGDNGVALRRGKSHVATIRYPSARTASIFTPPWATLARSLAM